VLQPDGLRVAIVAAPHYATPCRFAMATLVHKSSVQRNRAEFKIATSVAAHGSTAVQLTEMSKVGTYRIQLRAEFTFDAASAQVSYWQALGVSHLYCSPYLQASAGSTHGYDIVNHAAINAELGGASARTRLCASLENHGLRQLLDIVPNHMAIRGGHNAWWWDVLENGASSRYSSYFDVEWRSSEFERILLPILADQYGVVLEARQISLERAADELRVRYEEHSNPLAPSSIGHLLQPIARLLRDADLGFVADGLASLPSPHPEDREGLRRRHRDKQVLSTLLKRLLVRPEIAEAVDAHLAAANASPDVLHGILEQQNYRLAHWRAGSQDLDYRRFFDVDSLVGLHVEDEEVYDATHGLVENWLADGSVDGVRIDHIDGLYDPKGYLERVRARSATGWLIVEKILESDERCPEWPVSGTTGYDFLNQVQWVLVDPTGEAALTQACTEVLGQEQDYGTIVRQCKELILQEALGSDFKRLVNRLVAICQKHRRYRDYSRPELEELLREACIALPVYRTYMHPDHAVSASDDNIVRHVCAMLRGGQRRIDVRLVDFFERLLLLEWRDTLEAEFVLRWQQLTGPVMAKGVEDTAFYRYVRLVALNEVGGDPSCFAHTVGQFHEQMALRQAHHPEGLNATSTHDTKRSEDVRARLLALSEVPAAWVEAVHHWRHTVKQALPDGGIPLDPEAEYAVWQNLVGAWPIDKSRMTAFVLKWVREAKRRTSWHSPDERYEAAVEAYMTALYGNRNLTENVAAFVASLEPGFVANALNQVVLKLMCPGVPDIYQGTEVWDFSLVDPDNRRAVDYVLRRRALLSLDEETVERLWQDRADGRIKLHLLRQGLRLRAERPDCFGPNGTYQAVVATGSCRERVLAFKRGDDVVVVTTRFWLKCGDAFEDTKIDLPPGEWRNCLTNKGGFRGNVPVGELLSPLPSAILVRQAAQDGGN
jgi:(1->4)-alpha-D-glucan 1-alpha-D-glucosylmutase